MDNFIIKINGINKILKWTIQLKPTVEKIDKYIRESLWFDFQIIEYDGYKLTIAGSIDLIYYHTLEVVFQDVFFVSGFFEGWRSDTSKPVFILPENESEMNQKFEIEQGYQLFIFITEDYKMMLLKLQKI